MTLASITYYAALPLKMKHLCLIKWKDSKGEIQRYKLTNKVSTEWRRFGRQLSIEENMLEGWHKETLANAERCWEKVMQEWLEQGHAEYPTTWEGLYEMLEDVGYEGVALSLKDAVCKAVLHH